MYKLYNDKSKKFSCNVKVEGASINETKARIIVETKDYSFLYNGDVKQNGNCEIEIGKLKMLPENEQGKIKLEVIAESTLFTPWESDFTVGTEKKVKISEVYDPDAPTSINENRGVSVNVTLNEEIDKDKLNEHIEMLNRVLKKRNSLTPEKRNDVFKRYQSLIKENNIILNEKEINYIKNKII